MKNTKKKKNSRLTLERTTVAKLDGDSLGQVNGGPSYIKIGDIDGEVRYR